MFIFIFAGAVGFIEKAKKMMDTSLHGDAFKAVACDLFIGVYGEGTKFRLGNLQ